MESLSGADVGLSQTEQTIYETYYKMVDVNMDGLLKPQLCVAFFGKSLLPANVLAQIWQLCEMDGKTHMNQKTFYRALKLIALAQNKQPVTAATLIKEIPVPQFEGIKFEMSANPSQRSSLSQDSSLAFLPRSTSGSLSSKFSLPAESLTKYQKIFENSNPKDGYIEGNTARTVFLKSKLSTEMLGQIWALVDYDQFGKLDIRKFSVAMYVIENLMNGSLKSIPGVLSPPILAYIKDGSQNQLSTSTTLSKSEGFQSNPLQRKASVSSIDSFSMSSFAVPDASKNMTNEDILGQEWVVSTAEITKFGNIFNKLDQSKQGYLAGQEAVHFFVKSKLPEQVLAHVWELSDIKKSGRLSKEEFILAMFLIHKKLNNQEIPSSLPLNYIPPSFRNTEAQHPTLTVSIDNLNKATIKTMNETSQSKSQLANDELTAIQKQIDHIKKSTTDLFLKKSEIEAASLALKKERDELNSQLSTATLLYEKESQLLNNLTVQLNSEIEQLNSAKAEFMKIQSQTDQISREKTAIQEKISQTKEESARLQSQIRKLNEAASVNRKEIESLRKTEALQNSMHENSVKNFEIAENNAKLAKSELDQCQKNSSFSVSYSPNQRPSTPTAEQKSLSQLSFTKAGSPLKQLDQVKSVTPLKGEAINFDDVFSVEKNTEKTISIDNEKEDNSLEFAFGNVSFITIEPGLTGKSGDKVQRNTSVKSTKSDATPTKASPIINERSRPTSAPIPLEDIFAGLQIDNSPMKKPEDSLVNVKRSSVNQDIDSFALRFPEFAEGASVTSNISMEKEVNKIAADPQPVGEKKSTNDLQNDPFMTIATSKPVSLSTTTKDDFDDFEKELKVGATAAVKAKAEATFESFGDISSASIKEAPFEFHDFDKEFDKVFSANQTPIFKSTIDRRGMEGSAFDDVFGGMDSTNAKVTVKNQSNFSPSNFDDVFGSPTAVTSDQAAKMSFDEVFGKVSIPVANPVPTREFPLPPSTNTLSQGNTGTTVGVSSAPVSLSQKKLQGDDTNVQQLMAMGFEREKVVQALEKFNYNLENASNYLAEHS